mgnify:CR=1 FL=1
MFGTGLRQVRHRPIADILADLQSPGPEAKFHFFVDDNFVSGHERAKALMRELIPLKIRWVSQGSIDMTEDPELMDLVEASGCQGFVIGFGLRAPAWKPLLRSRRGTVMLLPILVLVCGVIGGLYVTGRNALGTDAATLHDANEDPESEAARVVAERHRLSIDRWFYPCSHAMHASLADMYEADARFAKTIDRYGDGLTPFLAAAIRANAKSRSARFR